MNRLAGLVHLAAGGQVEGGVLDDAVGHLLAPVGGDRSRFAGQAAGDQQRTVGEGDDAAYHRQHRAAVLRVDDRDQAAARDPLAGAAGGAPQRQVGAGWVSGSAAQSSVAVPPAHRVVNRPRGRRLRSARYPPVALCRRGVPDTEAFAAEQQVDAVDRALHADGAQGGVGRQGGWRCLQRAVQILEQRDTGVGREAGTELEVFRICPSRSPLDAVLELGEYAVDGQPARVARARAPAARTGVSDSRSIAWLRLSRAAAAVRRSAARSRQRASQRRVAEKLAARQLVRPAEVKQDGHRVLCLRR